MPGSSLFLNNLNKWSVPLWLASCCLTLPAQIHKVAPQKTITFPVAGATAAYSLDSTLAEATAENGVVSVVGKQPGTTHIVVLAASGVQTLEVQVTVPPPHYPPGFVMPVTVAEIAQSGYYEGRYYSSPAQVQNQFDFLKIHGDDRTHVHLVETSLVGPLEPGQPLVALSSASYQIVTPRRDITLFDKYVDESPLTLNGSIVRGFHMRQDNWFVHAGYTTVAAFQGLFLPTQPELVMGGGYVHPLTENSSITASAYSVRIPASDQIGHSGNIGAVSYKYSPRETFSFIADAGFSHGLGAASRFYYRTDVNTIAAVVRYVPLRFASVGINNFRGLHTDLSWTRHVGSKLIASMTFYNNNLVLPNLRETVKAGGANLSYQLTRHWSLTGGALASTFETKAPVSLATRSLTLPVGLAFQSKHFGATGQYQFAVTPGRETGGKQYRGSLRSGWGAFSFTGYAQRDTNAPTLSFVLGQVAGLQQVLDQQGLRATTIQQVDELLSSNSFLIAAGYIKGATINLVPVRTQIGGAADWSSRAVRHRKQLSYSFISNDNRTLQGSTQDIGHSLAYTQSLTRSDDLSMACSILGVKNAGNSRQYSPVCFISFRHQFEHVPYFIVPERHGTITGNVFRDDQSKGVLEPGMHPLLEVEVRLDDQRRALSNIDGTYRFSNVPRGKHRIVVVYRSKEPFFFTTPSDLEVDEDATVDFGIGYSLSGLMGQVRNDAGQGIPGIGVVIRSRGSKWTAVTEGDGSFFVSSMVAGEYDVQVEEDSVPAGYATDTLVEPQHVIVEAAAPGKAAFTARALRSISGSVLSYDSKAGKYVPVDRARVILRETGLNAVTDAMGRYLFRDLAAGAYTLSVQNQAATVSHTVRLGAQPVDLTHVDFQVGRTDPPDAAAVSAKPEVAKAAITLPSPPPPAALPPTPPAPPLVAKAVEPPVRTPVAAPGRIRDDRVSAQEHNARGRQLSRAGKYQDAIVELTEAIALEPDFPLAYNARGYAWFMLRDYPHAIADLDAATKLNPAYANAYRIRGAVKGAAGDRLGAAADLKRAQELGN